MDVIAQELHPRSHQFGRGLVRRQRPVDTGGQLPEVRLRRQASPEADEQQHDGGDHGRDHQDEIRERRVALLTGPGAVGAAPLSARGTGGHRWR